MWSMHLFYINSLALLIFRAILRVEAFDKTFLQLVMDISNHSDVILISDNLPEIPEKIQRAYQLSFEKRKGSLLTNFATGEHVGASIKIAISFSTILESLNALQQIGNLPLVNQDPAKFWILLHWPNPIANVTDFHINRTLENSLYTAVQNFTAAHDVFLAFRNPDVAISFHSGRDARFFRQPLEGFWFIELYSLNGALVYNTVENLASTIVQCGTCMSQTLRRLNLGGMLLRIGGVIDSEFNDDTLFTEENGSLEFIDSFSSRLLDILKLTLNFTTKAFKSETWGSPLPNGTWVGLVKDVYDGKLDIGLTTTVMLPSRSKLIAFLPASDENILTAFFTPPSLNAIRDIFMQPFQKSLWGAVFATWFALATSMILFTTIRKKVGATSATLHDPNFVEPDLSGDSFIWVLATACQQGWDEHPHALSLRTIFISGSFTGVIAYAGYSAAIVSTLSLRIDPIQSPQALLESNLIIGMRAGFINDLLQQSDTQDIVNALYRRLSGKESERLVNVTAAVTLIMKSQYAFICTKEQFYDIVKVSKLKNSDICGITELRILKKGFKAGMFTTKNFTYREFFRFILILIRERGTLWRIRDEFTYTRRCLEATDNSGRALGANDVFTAFVILSGGYVLSIAFLVLEKLFCLNPISYIQ